MNISSRFITSLILSFAVFAASSVIAQEAEQSEADSCYEPAAPIVPDGNVASQDELVAAQKAIKMFQTSLIDYRECLDGLSAALDPENEADEERGSQITARYNDSVAAEARAAEEFNVAVRAFKARQ